MRQAPSSAFLRVVLLLLTQLAWIAAAGSPAELQQTATPLPEPPSVTRPFTLDHFRIMVEVELIHAENPPRKVRAWVDTGNESMIIAESVAREIGLDTSALAREDGHGSVESASPVPRVLFGGLSLDTVGIPLRIYPGATTGEGLAAELHLPASTLRSFHVVFDYPERRMTVAQPGFLKPRGTAIPCRVNADTGLFLVDATIDGEIVALGVDTGSAGSWVSQKLTSVWQSRHPEWPSAVGAAGSTNFFGLDFEVAGTLMSLPRLKIAALAMDDAAVLGLDQRLFDWYSKKSAGAVAGFIGGNLLEDVRLEVHWPERMSYWEIAPRAGQRDLDIVGLTLRPATDGSFTVAGVVEKAGSATVAGITTGDRLLRVGSLDTAGATMGEVQNALRGTPGDRRVLLLEREGRTFTVDAEVQRLP